MAVKRKWTPLVLRVQPQRTGSYLIIAVRPGICLDAKNHHRCIPETYLHPGHPKINLLAVERFLKIAIPHFERQRWAVTVEGLPN